MMNTWKKIKWCPSGDGDPNDGIDEPRINYSKQLAELLVIGQGKILIAASELLTQSLSSG